MVMLITASSTNSYYASLGIRYQLLKRPRRAYPPPGADRRLGYPVLALLYILARRYSAAMADMRAEVSSLPLV